MILVPGDVHIWYRFTHSLDDHAVRGAMRGLSPAERARGERFVFSYARRDFAVAHALLRTVLSIYEPTAPDAWTFLVDEHGKPSLPVAVSGVPPLTFNLSHTRGLVACAVARAGDVGVGVGVDVESVDRIRDGQKIAERFFSRSELEMINGCPTAERAARFIELWTLKEAYLKAIGRGLGHPLSTFAFSFVDDGRLVFTAPPDALSTPSRFSLFAPSPEYRLAVAVPAVSTRCAPIVARNHDDGTVIAPLRTD